MVTSCCGSKYTGLDLLSSIAVKETWSSLIQSSSRISASQCYMAGESDFDHQLPENIER